ncbi:glycoside hydrolase domain-containing protein [Seonamhaeicola sp.]|uniref:DUF4091 domain-containing protein n=1 Tax=Seonamhaeicola sp. TaxID=1912245 RepID=UPI00262F0F99|nr:glycoside hydrolase domain-containing protein [Seonamhaeicola sp.]
MFNIKKISFLGGVLILLSGCFSKTIETKNEQVLDNVKNVPEWLRMNVDEALPFDSLNIWIPTNNFQTSSLIRVPRFPRKISDKEIRKNNALTDFNISPLQQGEILHLKAVKNEQVSAQLAIGAKLRLRNLEIEVGDLSNDKGEVFKASNIKIRYVKYLPVQRSRSEYKWSPKLESIVGEGTSGNMSPNVIGDPLVEAAKIDIPAYRAQPVWFTFTIPKNSNPGLYSGVVTVKIDKVEVASYVLELDVLDMEIPDPIDYSFHLDLWVNPSAIAGYYKLEHWSEKHWDLISEYLKEYASRGGKNITAIITQEPWHKPWIGDTTHSQVTFGYQSMVKWIKTTDNNWEFDFSVFDKYVEVATKAGITGIINAFSMTPFQTDQAIHYLDTEDNQNKVVKLRLNEPAYENAWTAFLIKFKKHLKAKNILDRVYLAFDEKPEEDMEILRSIIANAAPEFLGKITIAGHPEMGKYSDNLSISYMFFPGQSLEGKGKVPVLPTIGERIKQDKLTTFYLCAEPSHPNTMTYSPAIEGQLIPWLALKYNIDGYLRWAFNDWTMDPFNEPVFNHAQGDDYQIYPGKNGPISSIRWELLKEGIEDYELFNVIREKGFVSPEGLSDIIDLATRNQDGRYKNASDFLEVRNELLQIK